MKYKGLSFAEPGLNKSNSSSLASLAVRLQGHIDLEDDVVLNAQDPPHVRLSETEIVEREIRGRVARALGAALGLAGDIPGHWPGHVLDR